MRIARSVTPGVVYHVITRFIDRSWYIQTTEDRESYLRLLAHGLTRSDWRCLAYAVMSSHVHLAMLAGTAPLASWAKPAHSTFAAWLNHRHRRLGPVLANRPSAYAIAPHKVGDVIAYIHNNPVRAGLVARARTSDWTSHRAYAGLVTAPTWLSIEEGLLRSGFDDAAVFDAWVDATPGDSGRVSLSAARALVHRRGALEVATPSRAGIPLVSRPFAHVRIEPRRLVQLVSEVSGVAELVLCSRRLTPSAVDARHLAVHAAKALGLTGSEIAAALGVSAQTASRLGLRPLQHLRGLGFVIDRARLELGETGLRPSRANDPDGLPIETSKTGHRP